MTTTITSDRPDTPSGTRMRAMVQHAYGSADVLTPATVERPTIADDQVLVEVVAAGLGREVWHLVTGLPHLIRVMGFGLTRPRNPVPGADVAGRVVAVGPRVTRFGVGDEVFGIAEGSFAELAVAEESKLAHKPPSVTFEQAAVSAVSGITALQALTTVGEVGPGDRVLVIGASGGVGSFTVQLARALGATVTGVAQTSKLEAVRELGADEVIDHTTTAIDAGGPRFDLIIDIGGRNPLSRLRRALSPTGTLVIVGGEGGGRLAGGIGRQLLAAGLSPFTDQRLTFFISDESHRSMEELAGYLADGRVVPSIGRRFDLEEVPDALRALEAGEITGKAVISVAA